MTSSIKGVPISTSVKQLGEILKIPYVGIKIRTNWEQARNDYSKRGYYYSISRMSEEEFYSKRKRVNGADQECNILSPAILTIDDRILHYFLVHVLVPKYSNHSSITDVEMQLLYSIKNNLPINWAYMIMCHMLSHNEKSKGLSYGYILTKFQAF